MNRTTRNPRHTFAALLIVAIAAIVVNAQNANAGCCTIGVNNLSSCVFRICFVAPAGERCVDVASGANVYDIPGCIDLRIAVRDACGNVHYFPGAVGDCITVNIGGCCLLICKTSDCRYEIRDTHCLPC